MSIEGRKFYPGDESSPEQVLALAGEYRRAADALLQAVNRGKRLSYAPFRLLATHAIELYLNALLLADGLPSSDLRTLQHYLTPRALLAVMIGLNFKKRTLNHLACLCEAREYLISRYAPEVEATSQNNRLQATLREVGDKVTPIVNSVRG